MEKAPAGTVNPKDSQRAACSRTDALKPSRRTTAAAWTTNGFLGTGHGPVSGGGSAGEAAFVGAADSRTEREADPEQRLLLPRGLREMLCLSTAKCASGPSLSAAFIPRAHPRRTRAPPAAPLRASHPEEMGSGPHRGGRGFPKFLFLAYAPCLTSAIARPPATSWALRKRPLVLSSGACYATLQPPCPRATLFLL